MKKILNNAKVLIDDVTGELSIKVGNTAQAAGTNFTVGNGLSMSAQKELSVKTDFLALKSPNGNLHKVSVLDDGTLDVHSTFMIESVDVEGGTLAIYNISTQSVVVEGGAVEEGDVLMLTFTPADTTPNIAQYTVNGVEQDDEEHQYITVDSNLTIVARATALEVRKLKVVCLDASYDELENIDQYVKFYNADQYDIGIEVEYKDGSRLVVGTNVYCVVQQAYRDLSATKSVIGMATDSLGTYGRISTGTVNANAIEAAPTHYNSDFAILFGLQDTSEEAVVTIEFPVDGKTGAMVTYVASDDYVFMFEYLANREYLIGPTFTLGAWEATGYGAYIVEWDETEQDYVPLTDSQVVFEDLGEYQYSSTSVQGARLKITGNNVTVVDAYSNEWFDGDFIDKDTVLTVTFDTLSSNEEYLVKTVNGAWVAGDSITYTVTGSETGGEIPIVASTSPARTWTYDVDAGVTITVQNYYGHKYVDAQTGTGTIKIAHVSQITVSTTGTMLKINGEPVTNPATTTVYGHGSIIAS